jgi:hypothetical protein
VRIVGPGCRGDLTWHLAPAAAFLAFAREPLRCCDRGQTAYSSAYSAARLLLVGAPQRLGFLERGERLRGLGVRFTQEPAAMGPVTTAVLDDTCGNLIQIAHQGG